MKQPRISIYAYVDETGNTGHNIFDEDQPDFLTAALITRGDIDLTCAPRVRNIATQVGFDVLHAQRMGMARIENISENVLELMTAMNAHFFLSRVEKKYLLATKIFDSIFDSGENAAVSWENYNLRLLRIMLAFKVAHIIDIDTAKLFWKCLLVPKESEAYALLPTVCERLIENVPGLPDLRSRTIVMDGLVWARDHPEAIQILNDRRSAKHGHFPNMVAFTNLLRGLQHYSRLWNRPVARITHDQQCEFEKALKQYHELYSNVSSEELNWAGETYTLQVVPGSEFVVSEDANSPGIQIVDVILWVYSQYAKGKVLPRGCERLLSYAMDHAWINDFSFAGVEDSLLEKYGKIFNGEISAEDEARARAYLAEAEARRIASMKQYEKDRVPPFMRPELAANVEKMVGEMGS
jgi:hypothetical protein